MSDKPPPYQGPPGQPAYPTQPGYPPPGQGYPPPGQGYPSVQPGYGYPPGPPGYSAPPTYGAPPAMHTATTTAVIQQPRTVVVGGAIYGESPVSMVCPYCNATIVTAVSYSPGTLAWLACAGLILVGCGAGCCLIPFCVDGLQDAVHSCPNCQRQLGVYRRM